jgi:hydrogenase expression/formation protein HypD
LKYVDEFRDPETAQALLQEIKQLGEQLSLSKGRPIKLMEVCGGHSL